MCHDESDVWNFVPTQTYKMRQNVLSKLVWGKGPYKVTRQGRETLSMNPFETMTEDLNEFKEEFTNVGVRTACAEFRNLSRDLENTHTHNQVCKHWVVDYKQNR